MLWTARG